VPVVNHMHDKPGTGPYAGNQRSKYDDYLKDPRNRLWMYTSCLSEGCGDGQSDDPYWIGWPGYVIDEPASEGRAMGWLSFLYHTTGELYYELDVHLIDAWTEQFSDGGNGDGTLFYPGTSDRIGGTQPIPIESLRLKLIRDGQEDYEYLHWLQLHGMAKEARCVAHGLFPRMYETDRSDNAIQSARQQLADLIEGQGSCN
jgi:hypothetical protein